MRQSTLLLFPLLLLLSAAPAPAAEVLPEARPMAEEYMLMLDTCRTEVEFTWMARDRARAAGFRDLATLPAGTPLKPGDKLYIVNRDRAIILMVIGQEPVANGVNLLGAHSDSPRLDLKAHPVYTSHGFYLFQTYGFGGIKRYQWVNIPLQLHCNWVDAAGKAHHAIIGDDPSEPTILIPDLEPHLSRDYNSRTASDVIGAEEIDPIVGMVTNSEKPWNAADQPEREYPSVPEEEFMAMLQPLLKGKKLTRTDVATGQFHLTPALPSRYMGFDRSMVAGYGQDDRANSYLALKALLDLETIPRRTAMAYLVGQEEVGSVNNTGASSTYLNMVIARLIEHDPRSGGSYGDNALRAALQRSLVLSTDTPPAVNPIFPGVWEHGNSIKLGEGPAVLKWGSGRDPNPPFFAAVAALWNKAGIPWQAAPLGKNASGGGGTIGGFMSKEGMEVMDVGVSLVSLHSPYEVASVNDLWWAYQAFRLFLEEAGP